MIKQGVGVKENGSTWVTQKTKTSASHQND